ncbi:MAG: hypothetical protein Q9P44_17105 [Anaerolineae bacterium]|nr:hypothetical protein [Anaerolineae bacterium]
MTNMLQNIILNPWVVGILLLGAFFIISRWSLVRLKEYPGYALGVLIGLFFIMVYIALGGGTQSPPELDANGVEIAARTTLNIFEVLFATILGLTFGAGVMFALRFGTRFARGVSLQVASYTALNIILLFIAVIAGPITQRMIGIFALSIGIASLFAIVLFPDASRQAQVSSFSAQSLSDTGGMPPQQPPQVEGGGMSRLDAIRQKMRQKDQR